MFLRGVGGCGGAIGTRVLAARYLATAALKESHSSGEKKTNAHPFVDSKEVNTVGKLIDTVADQLETKDLYRHVENYDQLTYKETLDHVNALACGLPEANITHGKRFAFVMQNDSEQFVLRLAALRIGVTVGQIDIKKFHPNTVREYLVSMEPHSLMLTPKYDVEKKVHYVNTAIPEIPENVEIGRPLKLRYFPYLKSVFHTHKSKAYDGWYCYTDLFWKDPLPGTLRAAEQAVKPTDLAEIHYSRFFATSEALGFTQSSLVESALSFGAEGPFQDKRVAIAGDYSTPEVSTVLTACMAYGSYIMTSSFWLKVPNLIKDMAKEKCTVLVASPSELKQLMGHALVQTTKFSLETVLVLTNPNEIPTAEFLKEVQQAFKADKIEAAFIADGSIAPFLYLKDATSMEPNQLGHPILNTEVKIADASGKALPVGKQGRLLTKGVHVATTSSYEEKGLLEGDGWLDTGLKASMNSAGHVIYSE